MSWLNFTVENSTLPSIERWKHGQDYWTSFELYPDWTGKTFYVFQGKAYHQKDYWSGTMVAVKTFRDLTGKDGDWIVYKRRCEEARRMTPHFNKYLKSIASKAQIHFLKPVDAVMDSISDVMTFTRFFMGFNKRFAADEVVLFENLLEGEFKTFVTALGDTTDCGSEVLDAFCHFTYHHSGEQYIVCNLKGIEDECHFHLTNPTIHSRNGMYGKKDKGEIGIRDFFEHHVCNAICEHFTKPEHVHIQTSHTEIAPRAPLYSATESPALDSESDDYDESDEAFPGQSIPLPAYSPYDPDSPPPYSS